MSIEIHENDIGTVIEMTCKDGATPLDISGASTRQIIFQKPDGSTLTKTATLTTDGTDGKMEIETADGDMVPSGLWRMQGRLAYATGDAWKSSIEEFRVLENIATSGVPPSTTADNYNSWVVQTSCTGTISVDNVGNVFLGTGSYTVNMPSSSGYPGRLITVYSMSGTVTVNPNGTDQIKTNGAGVSDSVSSNTFRSYISNGIDDWLEWNQR